MGYYGLDKSFQGKMEGEGKGRRRKAGREEEGIHGSVGYEDW